MGSLPLEKASVGSAVNDTTRTTGGALGVAILGSLLASQYRGDMDEAVSGLPHGAAESASDTLSGGLAVAHRLGDSGLADAAQTAFVNGMHVAALAAAAVALAGAVIAYAGDPGARARAGAGAVGRPRSRSPHERDRRVAPAHAGAAPLRGVAPGDHPGDARAAGRGRLRRADDGGGADARRRRQGDDLPPLGLQGGARARRDRLPARRVRRARHRQPARRLRRARRRWCARARRAAAPRADAAAARGGRQRPRAVRDLPRQPRRAAPRGAADGARAGGRPRRDPRGRRPRADDRPVRRPGRLPAADHRRRHVADVLGRRADRRAAQRPRA